MNLLSDLYSAGCNAMGCGNAESIYINRGTHKKMGSALTAKKSGLDSEKLSLDGEGFWLNGRILKLCGFGRYQSWPYTGYAMPKSPQQLDADLLKFELGANAVRTLQGPASIFYGSMMKSVFWLSLKYRDGSFVGILAGKDYSEKCPEMIMQYRNHPSVILWMRVSDSMMWIRFIKNKPSGEPTDVYRRDRRCAGFWQAAAFLKMCTCMMI